MRVLLVPNTANPAAVSAAVELATWLAGRGLEPRLATDDAAQCGLADLAIAPSEIGEPALTVALMRWSMAPSHMAISPPSESPAHPILVESTEKQEDT